MSFSMQNWKILVNVVPFVIVVMNPLNMHFFIEIMLGQLSSYTLQDFNTMEFLRMVLLNGGKYISDPSHSLIHLSEEIKVWTVALWLAI